MYSQCVMLQQRLQTRQASSYRGGGGDGKRRGGAHEHGRLALEGERPPADEGPRVTTAERSMAKQEGWDPTTPQLKGFLMKRAEDVQKVGECFCYQLYGSCPFGDTTSTYAAKGCK
jgi:hypothetical protein